MPAKASATPGPPEGVQETWGLAQRLAWVQARVQRIAHDTEVRGKESYKATSIDAIADLCRPLLAEACVATIPRHTTLLSCDEITSKGGARGFHALIEVTWTIAWPHGEESASSIGESIDYSDKALNKCHTYARKNLLVAMLNLSTGENPEAESPEAGHRQGAPSEPRRPADPPPRPAPIQASADEMGAKRRDALNDRAARDDINDTEVELKVREAIGTDLAWPTALANDTVWAQANEALKALLVERGKLEATPKGGAATN